MAALGDTAAYATGDPSLCRGCRACLSAVSNLAPATANTADTPGDNEGVYEWVCEYCHEVNRVELDDMEKPVDGQDSVDYVLEAAPAAAAAVLEGKGNGGAKVCESERELCSRRRGDRVGVFFSRVSSGKDARNPNRISPGGLSGASEYCC